MIRLDILRHLFSVLKKRAFPITLTVLWTIKVLAERLKFESDIGFSWRLLVIQTIPKAWRRRVPVAWKHIGTFDDIRMGHLCRIKGNTTLSVDKLLLFSY